MSQGRNVGMPESGDAMSHRSASLSIVPRGLRVLKSLPGEFRSSQMLRLSLLLGHTMCVRWKILQFGGTLLAVLVIGCVFGHIS
jgi:hypothetical protein